MKPLTQNDEALLRGRSAEIQEIVDNCLADRLTVVTAEPGLGITSLLEAGAAPALKRAGYIVATFRDWQGRAVAVNFKEAIAQAVRDQANLNYFAQDEPLGQALHRIRVRTGKPVALLLDQFEDYLRCHENTDISDAFDADLANAVAAREGRFVIGMQEQALPAFERFRQFIPNLLGFRIQLSPLTPEAACEAVEVEAGRLGIKVEPAAMQALLTAPIIAGPGGGVHPFFLKTATAELSRVRVVTMQLIELRGGVDRIVLESLDAAIAEMGSTHAELLFRWCNILISVDKSRLSVTEKGLTEYAGRFNRFVPALLPLVSEAQILRSVETPGAIRYEIARECLTPILRDWWERREAAIVARRRAVFRTTSFSLAVGGVLASYIAWIFLSK